MQKKVQRSEVNISVGKQSAKEVPTSSARTGPSLEALPNPDDLRTRYGLPAQPIAEETAVVEGQSAQLQELQRAMEVMQTRMDEKNRKIEQMCVLLEALEPVPGVHPERILNAINSPDDDIDLRDQKIVSLAKKSHGMSMLLNKERSAVEKLRKELEEERQRSAALSEELSLERSAGASRAAAEHKVYNRHSLAASERRDEEDKSAAAQGRALREAQKTAEELKRRAKELSEENKHLSRALAKELGEGSGDPGSLLEATHEPSWRGRAQLIVMLKAKVKGLEAQLGGGGGGGRGAGVDAKAEDSLADMTAQRRAVAEALSEERLQLMDQLQALEKKGAAHRARIKILEDEVRRLRENLLVALDKSANDDQLLEAFRAEVQRLSKRKPEDKAVSNDNSSSSSRDMQQTQQMESELRRLQRLVKHQADQIEAQDVTLRDLRKRMSTIE